MPFKPSKKQPQFADLKGILAQSKETDNALYRTIQTLIERLTQLKDVTNDEIDKKLDDGTATLKFASKFATYHTKDNETALLPNSVQLLAGAGIAFDDTVPNKRTISSTGGGGSSHYDTPLTDGDPIAADLIFADGECIIVQVPI